VSPGGLRGQPALENHDYGVDSGGAAAAVAADNGGAAVDGGDGTRGDAAAALINHNHQLMKRMLSSPPSPSLSGSHPLLLPFLSVPCFAAPNNPV